MGFCKFFFVHNRNTGSVCPVNKNAEYFEDSIIAVPPVGIPIDCISSIAPPVDDLLQ